MRHLTHIYEQSGLRGSFNAEVMQQLACRRLATEHPELSLIADEWDQAVRETYERGHDIQLHLHPQWSDATYRDGRWNLRGAWSLLDYAAPQMTAMLRAAKQYLEQLLTPIDRNYRCVTFRSGSWCIAPSHDTLPTLAALGIAVDMSIVNGIYYESPHVTLDYRHIEEPLLPYYPVMDDARRVAATEQPIVCVPTFTFQAGLLGFGFRLVARSVRRRTSLAAATTARFVAPRDTAIPDAGYEREAYFRDEWGSGPGGGISSRANKVSDLSCLSYFQMKEMLGDLRRRARRAGVAALPVVLQNHTKDVGDFAPLQLLAREIAATPDLSVITLTELARNLRSGRYPVRRAAG